MTITDGQQRESLPERWRVLIVENDPKQRDDHVQNLIGWGYEVYIAEVLPDSEDAFDALRVDALRKCRSYKCHLALIDQRLQSDVNQQDSSGLTLADQLEGAQCIILSGYPPPPPERDMSSRWVRVGKQEGPERLKHVLDTLVANMLRMASDTCCD